MQGVLEAATEQGGGAVSPAAAALAALAPTWLASGQPVHSLLSIVISSLASMQPLHRLTLLSATLHGLPQVGHIQYSTAHVHGWKKVKACDIE